MKFSTRAPSSFPYVYSLPRNAERSIHEFLIFLCRQFSDVVRQTTLKKIYTYVCMRACSILSSAKITVIEHINKATDFKRLGVARANVGFFYSFLLSHLVPTETTICRLISTYIRVSKSFLKIKCLHLLMGESLEEGSAGKYTHDDQRRIGQVWSQQFHPGKVSEAQRLNYRKTWPALPQHYQG